MEYKEHEEKSLNGSGFLGWIGRLIAVAIVLGITSFFTPGFTIKGLWSFLIAAVIITVSDYVVEKFMGIVHHPLEKV